MKLLNKKFWQNRFIKPGIFEILILVLFLVSGACLEVSNVLSSIGLSTDLILNNYSAKMVEVNGFIYVANNKNQTIDKIDISNGTKVVWSGTSGTTGSTNGAVGVALYSSPRGIAYKSGASPKLYVIESANCTLREIDMNTQMVSTVAGSAGLCSHVDGTGSAASFGTPTDVALIGGFLYISEYGCIRKVDLSTYAVTTPVGAYGVYGTTNGVGTAAQFSSSIYGLAVIGNNLFVADSGNQLIRKVDLTTLTVTTLAGVAGSAGFVDGVSGTAKFNDVTSITSDGSNMLFVSDYYNNAVRSIDATTGAVTTIVGDKVTNEDIDGTVASAKVSEPLGVYLSNYGLFVSNIETVRRLH